MARYDRPACGGARPSCCCAGRTDTRQRDLAPTPALPRARLDIAWRSAAEHRRRPPATAKTWRSRRATSSRHQRPGGSGEGVADTRTTDTPSSRGAVGAFELGGHPPQRVLVTAADDRAMLRPRAPCLPRGGLLAPSCRRRRWRRHRHTDRKLFAPGVALSWRPPTSRPTGASCRRTRPAPCWNGGRGRHAVERLDPARLPGACEPPLT